MIDADRVVGRLRELVQDFDFPTRVGCRGEDRLTEKVLRHNLRTGEGED